MLLVRTVTDVMVLQTCLLSKISLFRRVQAVQQINECVSLSKKIRKQIMFLIFNLQNCLAEVKIVFVNSDVFKVIASNF